jgi:hypothetical protein
LGFFAFLSGLVRRMARRLKGRSPRSWHEDLVPRLFVRRLENRCVLNGQTPAGTEVLVVIANSAPNSGPRDTVLLTRQGDEVEAFVDGTLSASANYNDLQAVILVGTDKPDTFLIDFSGGNPIPYAGVQAFGGGNPVSAASSIVLESSPTGATFSSLVHQAVGFGQGSMQLQFGGSTGTINYSGVNFVEDTVSTQNAVLDDGISGDSLLIGSPPGGDQVTVTSVQSPTVAFSSAPGSLTVDTSSRTAAPADTIDIQNLLSNSPMNLAVQSAAGDTIGISGTNDLDGGNLAVSGSSIQISGTFTSGSQTYNGPVKLLGDTALASTTAGNITFNSTVDGAQLLQVDTAGTQVFNGVVGGQTPLAGLISDATNTGGSIQFDMPASGGTAAGVAADSVTLDGAVFFNVGNSTLNGPTVLTSGAQTYNGPVQLQADTVLVATAGGNITFNATVDGAHLLDVDTAGTQVFNGVVGGQAPLTGLVADTVNTGGSIQFNMAVPGETAAGVSADSVTLDGAVFFNVGNSTLNGPTVLTSGAQTYNGPVQLQADSVFVATAGGNITFNATVDGAHLLEVDTAGTQAFNGAVGSATPLTGLVADPESAGGSIQFNMTLSGGTTAGVSADSLTLDGAAFFNAGNSTLNSPTVRTSDSQTYNGPVQLQADTVLIATAGGNITFNATVDGEHLLEVDTAGTQAFNGAVGSATPLASFIADPESAGGSIQFNMTASATAAGVAADSLTLDGVTFFNVGSSTQNAPSVRTSGAQTYNGPVQLQADTVLVATAGGNITFNATVDGTHLLNVDTAGTQAFNDAVGGQVPLTGLIADALDAGGSIQFNMAASGGTAAGVAADSVTLDGAAFFNVGNSMLNGPTVRTSDAQTYNGAVQLQADSVFVATAGGNITFHSTVDGTHLLEVDTSGTQAFDGAVGGQAPLTGLIADAADAGGAIQFNMALSGGTAAGVSADSLTLDGAAFFNVGSSTMNTPSVRTTGAQTYNGQVWLQADTVLATTADGNIDFNSTIDSAAHPYALALDATGTIYFGNNVGSIGPLSSVTSPSNAGVTIASGRTISTVTGAVSSAPPVLYVYQTNPFQEQIYQAQLTQTVYGYIGFVGAPSGYNELGQNYDIEVLWADGSVTMSNSQNSPIAYPSPGFGSYVGYGTVATMTSVPGSPGVWTYNNTSAALPGFLPPAGNNGITFAISHTYSLSFVANHQGGMLTAVIKLVNNSSIQLSNPAQDGNIATGAPPAASSLNAVQTMTSVPITSGVIGVRPPAPFVPPAAIAPLEVPLAPVITSTPPPQAVNTPSDLAVRQDAIVAERRMIEIVKLDPDGNPEKEAILTDVPEKLDELLEKLKLGAYRNGRYAVYLTEYSVSGHAVIGRRLLMVVYKSGHTLGDPVHEPGPGSNPLPKESPAQKPGSAPNVHAPRTAAEPAHAALTAAARPLESLPAAAARRRAVLASPRMSPDRAGTTAHYFTFAGCSLAAAAVVVRGRGRQSAEDGWANRVDRVLGDSQVKSLRRMARLARARRRKEE